VSTQLHLITVDFRDLRQGSKASILLNIENPFRWCSASTHHDRCARFSIGTLNDSPLSIRQFIVNSREAFWETYGACDLIHQELCVRGDGNDLRGIVELPPGASVTLKSLTDRTSIIGQSSFALSVKSER